MFDSPSQRPEHFSLNPYSPLSEGLVFAGLGQLVGSSLLMDSAFGRNGSLIGYNTNPWWYESSLSRHVINFDGSNDYGKFDSDESLMLISKTFSFAAWVYLPSLSTQIYVAWKRAGGYGWMLRVNNPTNGKICFTSANFADVSSVAAFSSTGWHHIGVTSVNGAPKFYLDGAESASSASFTNLYATAGPLYIGARENGGSTPNAYSAQQEIDLLIYDGRVLSPADFTQLADPSNHMLSGLILPPKRKYYRATTTSGLNLAAAVYYYQRMIAG